MIDPYAVAEKLRDCLCANLATTVGGPVCQCCIRTGSTLPPADNCCDCGEGQGQASIQVGEIYPSDKWPRKGVVEWKGACSKGMTIWVAEFTMVVYRCMATPVDDGTPPNCTQLQADARKVQEDAAAMLRTFSCCDLSSLKVKRVLPGSWTPLPNLGGCGGGQLNMFADLGYVCCPPPD